MKNTNNRFQRYQRPVFICDSCGRSTRLAGQGNDSLCLECWELAGLQNVILDGGEIAEIALDRDHWFAKAVRLGSDPVRIKAQFPELWAAKE
jgi:hypothetical protein